jgi:hypothetical protein
LCVRHYFVPLSILQQSAKKIDFFAQRDTTPLKTRTALAIRLRIGENKRPFSYPQSTLQGDTISAFPFAVTLFCCFYSAQS